ncbi:MAG: class I SAM-dependent methyltransferase [Desulfovibrio sp.]|jgi:16S rRNA (guanine527-N7)-methyltransferase|nr:class I SAM-dependent methyltransferase [Desulfovibrio sp.]
MSQKMQHPVNRRELASLAAEVATRARLGEVPGDALEGLAVYLELLVRWNAVFNLVSPGDWREIFTRLAVDSFYLADFLSRLPLPETPQTWDFGAGAGLPGVPLRLIWTQGEYCMVERREKRAIFLSTVLSILKLERTCIFRGTVENFFAFSRRPSGRAHCIVSRAFLPWRELLDLTRAHLPPDGVLIVFAVKEAPSTLPDHWTLAGTYAYTVANRHRYFWALSPSGG